MANVAVRRLGQKPMDQEQYDKLTGKAPVKKPGFFQKPTPQPEAPKAPQPNTPNTVK